MTPEQRRALRQQREAEARAKWPVPDNSLDPRNRRAVREARLALQQRLANVIVKLED